MWRRFLMGSVDVDVDAGDNVHDDSIFNNQDK